MNPDIRILYWNVWCLPALFTDGMHSDDRAKAILPFIQGFDIVILNEAWTKAAKKVFRSAYPYYYNTPKKGCKIFDSGLMILSTHPIINPSYEFYSDAAGWDWFSSKGVIHVKIPINNKIYDVITTHMQAGHTLADHRARIVQMNELTSFIKRKVNGNSEVLLIGDFNVMPLQNGVVSVHCKDYFDAVRRSQAYFMIPKDTGMVDTLKGRDILSVYHVFVKKMSAKVNVLFHKNNITDGEFLTIDYTS